jgi:polysaccharide biosynthesis/export protein
MVFRTLSISAFLVLTSFAYSQSTNPRPVPPQQVVPPNVGIPVATPEASQADSTKPSDKDKSSQEKPAPGGASAATKDAAPLRPPYVIGPDDTLFVRVWKQGDLSGSVTVGPDGTISMQLINDVKAAGLTLDQLKQVLIEKLSKFINEPEVNIQLISARSRTYIIQGEVNRTGVFPLIKPTTILEALVNGGGFAPFANKKKIYILRGSQRIYFNWNEVSKGKKMEQNIEVQNGDQIFVP